MEIKIISDLQNQECDVLVVNLFEGEKTTQELANKYAIEEDKFEGKFGETYLLPTYGKQKARKILVIGFGKKEEFCPDKLRKATGKALKKANQMEAKTVAFDYTGLDFCFAEQFTYGVGIADYAFDKYKTKKDKHVETVYVNTNEDGVRRAEKITNAMKISRDLANEPAQYATPSKLAEIAQGLGLDTKVYDKEECERMGMGAYLAVAKGSAQPPKFIHMKYSIPNPRKKIAIIGKGICFDSGGLDIKPASSMLTMKDDMSGAACVIGVMSAIKEFAPDVEVHGIIAACENMPGCSAYKPGDILTAKNGKTIEVDNTDAEGRLTLADALCYADELGVDEIIDLATLTGACMVALGTQAAGIVGIASISCCIYGYLFGLSNIIPPFSIIAALCLGFLIFNKYPASIFMGDTGSFVLGTGYAAAVLVCDIPYFGVLALGVPIISVVVSLLHRAHIIKLPVEPLHHTLNHYGMSEVKIILTYWGATALLCLIGILIKMFIF